MCRKPESVCRETDSDFWDRVHCVLRAVFCDRLHSGLPICAQDIPAESVAVRSFHKNAPRGRKMSGGHLLCADRSGTEAALRRRRKMLQEATRRRRKILHRRIFFTGSICMQRLCRRQAVSWTGSDRRRLNAVSEERQISPLAGRPDPQ